MGHLRSWGVDAGRWLKVPATFPSLNQTQKGSGGTPEILCWLLPPGEAGRQWAESSYYLSEPRSDLERWQKHSRDTLSASCSLRSWWRISGDPHPLLSLRKAVETLFWLYWLLQVEAANEESLVWSHHLSEPESNTERQWRCSRDFPRAASAWRSHEGVHREPIPSFPVWSMLRKAVGAFRQQWW